MLLHNHCCIVFQVKKENQRLHAEKDIAQKEARQQKQYVMYWQNIACTKKQGVHNVDDHDTVVSSAVKKPRLAAGEAAGADHRQESFPESEDVVYGTEYNGLESAPMPLFRDNLLQERAMPKFFQNTNDQFMESQDESP
jgi:hypothetical protein